MTEAQALLPVLAFGVKEAPVHAKISAFQARKGRPIGAYDLIIAATALSHHHSVATLNESEFQKVPDLVIKPVRKYRVK